MKFLRVLFGYFKWHYGKAIITSFSLWKNLTVFLFNYFSIQLLIGNFFAPWRRLAETYPKWYEFKEFFSSLFINLMMRIVGVIIRFFAIIIGVICVSIFVISYPLALIAWLAWPFLILALIIIGLILIIKG